jgi:teichuronic acid biosynthesis glycosyltransferase TuaG
VSAPLVSVIMPAHNAGRYLDAAIRSVLEQTFGDWELLVAENGSRDDTPDILAAHARAEPRIRPLALGRAVGPAAARNAAFAEARGRYLAMLDADDAWLPEKLVAQLEFMRAVGAGLTHTTYGYMDVLGRPIRRPQVALDRITYTQLLRRTSIGCLTVMLDRALVGDVRMPDLPQHEDLVLWFRLLRAGHVARGLDRMLARYRVVPGSASGRPLRSAGRMWRVYRREEGLPLPTSAWYFAQYAWWAVRKRI